MDPETFLQFRDLVYDRSGIYLRDGKESLVCARVGKRMRALGLDDYRDYLKRIRKDESGEELVQLLDAISTNVTSFFREPGHFDFLGERLKEWAGAGQKRFRMWSAASSTGEEPYTMAMVLLETARSHEDIDARILATDISTKVLEQCRLGSYPEKKLETVPTSLRTQYFERSHSGDGYAYTATEKLRKPILFRRLNLSTPPFPMQGPLDVIFCRNVMIYFDNEVRRKLLAEMYRLLKPGGYLMVGHAESLTGMVSDFKVVKPSIYTKT